MVMDRTVDSLIKMIQYEEVRLSELDNKWQEILDRLSILRHELTSIKASPPPTNITSELCARARLSG